MNLKLLSLLIMSLFIISCAIVTENDEETAGNPFEFATGDIVVSDIQTEDIRVDNITNDKPDSTNDKLDSRSETLVLPKFTEPIQEYLDYQVFDGLVQDFYAVTDCDQNVIRTPVANLTWASSSLTPENLRLDVTHYGSLGFSRNSYLSLDVSQSQEILRFTNIYSADEEFITNTTLPDLSVLEFNSDESITELTVSGLEPGIIYKWRLVGYVRDEIFATPSRRLIGKTCIADLIEEEE